MRYTIGIDLGGTNIAAGLLDETYNIIDTVSLPTNAPRAAAAIVTDMAWLVDGLQKKHGVTAARIGIGAPGIISDGIVRNASNLRFDNVPLAEMVASATHLPCRLGNDANAAALGEYMAGAAQGVQSLLMVMLGTGIGGGIIVDGKIIDGFNGAGGEIGHFTLYPDGRQCSCGRKGCFEAYCSASALAADTIRAMFLHPESVLWKLTEGDFTRVNGKTAFDGMRQGDAVSTAIVNEYISNLGVGLSSLVMLLQPEVIAIGGGISREGETLLAPLREIVETRSYYESATPRTRLIAAKFLGEAGIVGAAALWGDEYPTENRSSVLS